MANFKGGFAFNNEAAKVEVEQAPDGTLISCVNPVTGEELGGGGVEITTLSGNFNIKNGYSSSLTVKYMGYLNISGQDPADTLLPKSTALSQNGSKNLTDVALIDGRALFTPDGYSNAVVKNITNCTVETQSYGGFLQIWVTPTGGVPSITIAAS